MYRANIRISTTIELPEAKNDNDVIDILDEYHLPDNFQNSSIIINSIVSHEEIVEDELDNIRYHLLKQALRLVFIIPNNKRVKKILKLVNKAET